jgi:hypothetical protein
MGATAFGSATQSRQQLIIATLNALSAYVMSGARGIPLTAWTSVFTGVEPSTSYELQMNDAMLGIWRSIRFFRGPIMRTVRMSSSSSSDPPIAIHLA